MENKIRKISLLTISCLLCVLGVVGCTVGKDLNNTPTKQVETLLSKYQTLDENVLKDLDKVSAEDESFTGPQREKYREFMKKHYSNMVYKIKDETIDGDEATVEVEIEVYDYTKTLKETEEYRRKHEKEFYDESDKFDASLYADYKLKQLEKTKEKVTYTLEIHVSKKDGKWVVNALSKDDQDKLNGVYED